MDVLPRDLGGIKKTGEKITQKIGGEYSISHALSLCRSKTDFDQVQNYLD